MRYALLLLPLLASCSAEPSKTDASATTPLASAGTLVDANKLAAYHWQLRDAVDRSGQRIQALFARPQQPLQLDFGAERLGVTHACNSIGGGFRIDNGRLVTGRLAQTMMACGDPAIAALDSAIGSRLESRPRIELPSGAEPRLRLSTDSGDTLDFAGEPTAETRYGGPGETVFLEVDSQTQPCPHPLMRDHRCLKVRERRYDANGLASGAPGEWQLFYQDIEGYTHEAGTRNVLRVKRYAIRNPPADAPSQAYVLDLVVESERVES